MKIPQSPSYNEVIFRKTQTKTKISRLFNYFLMLCLCQFFCMLLDIILLFTRYFFVSKANEKNIEKQKRIVINSVVPSREKSIFDVGVFIVRYLCCCCSCYSSPPKYREKKRIIWTRSERKCVANIWIKNEFSVSGGKWRKQTQIEDSVYQKETQWDSIKYHQGNK